MREMKDSGIDYIGQIPLNWKECRLKFLCLITTGNEDTQNSDPDGEFPFYVRSPIIEKSKKYTFDGEGILVAGDGAGAGRIFHHAYGKYAVHQRVYRLYNFGFNSNFICYYLSNLFPFEMDKGSAQSTVPSMRLPMLSNFTLFLPELTIASKIADFLDQKCSEIDALTADIQTQIETLEEYKKSVITEAVTKGLDPNVEMKDSGIQWVDKIPANWKVNKIKYISNSIFKGQGIKKEDVDINGDIQCVRYGEIYSKYSNSFNQCFSFVNSNNLSRKQPFIKNGDIIFAITGELIEEIGKNILYTGELDCAVGGDIVVVRIDEDRRFINYALNSSYCQNQKSCNKFKLKVVHISAFEIGNILVLIPPLSIQKAISDFLDLKCAEINQTISEKQQQLDTLAEYKKSMIYEYVTGKKEVA